MKKNIFIILCICAAGAFWTGCKTGAGVVGALSSEPESEKVTPAEFKLAQTEGKIAIFVSQPGWIKTPIDLRVTVTEAINAALEEKEKTKIKKERLVLYSDVLKCRMSLPDEKRDDPFEIVSKLNAQYVLAVQITDFELSAFTEENLFNGTMQTKTCLFDAKGSKIWPQSEECKQITVVIEDEKGTAKSAVEMLSGATAHCITRYFYNCKTTQFRIAEEPKELDFYNKW